MLDFGFYNMDCLEGMKQFPDKFFDLAIVDPPYDDAGGGAKLSATASGTAANGVARTGGKWAAKYGKK